MKYTPFLLVACALFAACGPATPPATLQLVNVHASSAAYPWLVGLYSCPVSSAAINVSDPQSADISIRLGEPANLMQPAYQIGREELLVVVPAAAGVASLTLDQVQSLFSGRVLNWQEVGGSNLPVQVWTFSPDTDVEGVFDDVVMKGEPITSLARLAVSVQAMSDAIGSTSGSIGLLPRRALDVKVHEVYTAASVPVLAITKSEPQGAIKDLLACAQSGK